MGDMNIECRRPIEGGHLVWWEEVGWRDRVKLALRLTTVELLRGRYEAEDLRRHNAWRIARLGRYNAEVSRGILHAPGYTAEMEREQEAFNRGEMGR